MNELSQPPILGSPEPRSRSTTTQRTPSRFLSHRSCNLAKEKAAGETKEDTAMDEFKKFGRSSRSLKQTMDELKDGEKVGKEDQNKKHTNKSGMDGLKEKL